MGKKILRRFFYEKEVNKLTAGNNYDNYVSHWMREFKQRYNIHGRKRRNQAGQGAQHLLLEH
jgi:hypothetical protein